MGSWEFVIIDDGDPRLVHRRDQLRAEFSAHAQGYAGACGHFYAQVFGIVADAMDTADTEEAYFTAIAAEVRQAGWHTAYHAAEVLADVNIMIRLNPVAQLASMLMLGAPLMGAVTAVVMTEARNFDDVRDQLRQTTLDAGATEWIHVYASLDGMFSALHFTSDDIRKLAPAT